MTLSLTFTVPIDHPQLDVLLGILRAPVSSPPMAAPGRKTGSTMDLTGLAILDAAGAAIVADPRNALPPYLDGLRLMASKKDVTEAELMTATRSHKSFGLAGHKAATTKRVQTALGDKKGAVLFRIEEGKVVIAPETRIALARHFGFIS